MSEAPVQTLEVNPVLFLAGGVTAIVGYFAVVNITNALGYGSDTHAWRVAALTFPLFIGGMLAAWPRVSRRVAPAILLAGIALGIAGWVVVPCRLGGPSLLKAVSQRGELRTMSAVPPNFNELSRVREITAKQEFAADFPSLAETVDPLLDDWAKAAVAIIADRLERVSPDDVGAVDAVVTRADLIKQELPRTQEAIAAAERAFSDRSADYWAAQLLRITPGKYSDYLAWWQRCRSVKSLSPNWDRLAESQEAWTQRSADSAIESAYYLRRFRPERSREHLLTAARSLREVCPKEVGKGTPIVYPFTRPHRKLFEVALGEAQTEAREQLSIGAYDRALTAADTFINEWLPEAEWIGPEAVQSAEGFRIGYRYLQALAAKAGDDPGAAPPPRTRP